MQSLRTITFVAGDIFTFEPPKRTLKAWLPYYDTVSILFEFQNSDIDDEHYEWRLNWISGIALLRTVGHVLSKSDAKVSAKHRSEIDLLWKVWSNDKTTHAIFWDFVIKERNNILKTYDLGATLVTVDGRYHVKYSDGSDAMRLYREAIYWWRFQLMVLEDAIFP